jgi:hypothetical protein
MLKLWKRAILISVGVAALAYEELKKSADRMLKETRQAARRTA